MQHSTLTWCETQQLIKVVAEAGCIPFVRVPSANIGDILKACDAGALGIVVPMVESVEEARNAVLFSKYPIGHRDYGTDEEASRRYSPPEVIGTIETAIMGEPEPVRVCTSHVERSNLTLRMQIRRLTRLTNGHSKKWENHEAAIALFIAYYNFCRVHRTIKKTPAQEAGLTVETWSLEMLLDEVSRV